MILTYAKILWTSLSKRVQEHITKHWYSYRIYNRKLYINCVSERYAEVVIRIIATYILRARIFKRALSKAANTELLSAPQLE